jgi:hypothetical protein
MVVVAGVGRRRQEGLHGERAAEQLGADVLTLAVDLVGGRPELPQDEFGYGERHFPFR